MGYKIGDRVIITKPKSEERSGYVNRVGIITSPQKTESKWQVEFKDTTEVRGFEEDEFELAKIRLKKEDYPTGQWTLRLGTEAIILLDDRLAELTLSLLERSDLLHEKEKEMLKKWRQKINK